MAVAGERVILLHGLWLRGYAMQWLARRLQQDGFSTDIFSYYSLYGSPEQAALRLRDRITKAGAVPVHVIGHSLGGLVATLACTDLDLPGRTLCLGSPLTGSAVAGRLVGIAPWLVGRSQERLIAGLPPWTGPRQLGVIAGNRGVGLGRLLGRMSGANDGTVTVAETELPGLTDHLVLPLGHSGLIFSEKAAQASIRFLRHGSFKLEPTPQT